MEEKKELQDLPVSEGTDLPDAAAESGSAEPAESMDDYAEDISRSFQKIRPGDLITGTVIGSSESEVNVDFGYYTEGYIPLEECSNDPRFSIRTDVIVGEEVSCLVLREDLRDGRLVLSRKKADGILAWAHLKEALETKKIYEVKIAAAVKSGVTVYLEGIRGFIPASQLSLTYVENLEDWVGRTVEAVVITAEEEGSRLVLSAKEVAREKAEADRNSRISRLQKGIVLTGTVEKLAPYGVFVNIGDDLSGLVHISQMCGHRIKSPKELVKEGDEVKVKVIDIKDGKISLSMKAVQEEETVLEDVEDAPTEYKSDGSASTSLASLLAGFTLPE